MSTIPCLATGCARLPGEALNGEGYRGLVARYAPINQVPGGLALYDSSRRGPAGVLTNIPVANWESSEYGPVVNFPAANSSIIVPSRADLEPLELTVRVLFRMGPVMGALGVLRKGAGVGARDYALRTTALGALIVQFDDGILRVHNTAGGLIAINQWYDVTFTIGLGRCRIWLDGALVLDDAEANAMPQSGLDLTLGALTGASSFEGKLALVEIWNYCLPKPLSPDPHFLAYAD